MKRTTQGYTPRFAVQWGGYKQTAPCLMNWALEVAKRMRARGHNVFVVQVRR